ncbi:MAG: S16 family serine protease [Candidatus Woesearchaeota archaeon]
MNSKNDLFNSFAFLLFFLVLTILFLPNSIAAASHITLLAVSENDQGNMTGNTANLFLEVRPGTGKVFIDTYPLSKFDTQLSIRFARDIACKFSKINCNNYDFLYTIRAQSRIIGGPSAGAAIAVLTYSELLGLDIDDKTAITGTINSGRLVGNVGSIKEKIHGASKNEIRTVLIPINELYQEQNNITLDMVEYGNSIGVNVIGVSDLEDAIFYFTGKNVKTENVEIKMDEGYLRIMNSISEQLCDRSYEIIDLINELNVELDNIIYKNNSLNVTYTEALDMLQKAAMSYGDGKYYASSSQCFGANTKLYGIYLFAVNLTNYEYYGKALLIQDAIDIYRKNLSETTFNTIPSFQTALVVLQRLEEAQNYLDNVLDFFNTSNITRETMIDNLAFSNERLYTTRMWAQFFDLEGEPYNIDRITLKMSCNEIVEDALSRIQYSRLYLPTSFTDQERRLRELLNEEDYAFCISSASLIRADINSLISMLGVREQDVEGIVERKLGKVSEILAEETANGRFPLLGYSYFEYATALIHTNPISALIYAEYALEISNLDIYFSLPNQQARLRVRYNYEIFIYLFSFAIFLFGFMIGIIFVNQSYKNHYSKKLDETINEKRLITKPKTSRKNQRKNHLKKISKKIIKKKSKR